MSGIRAISAASPVAVLALALAACTGTTTVVKYVGGSGSASAAAAASRVGRRVREAVADRAGGDDHARERR